MDRLAAMSTVFKRAYCNAPLCNPSRSSAWSGLSVQDTKVFDNITSLKTVNPSAVLLPQYIATKGYSSTVLGKTYHVYAKQFTPVPDVLPATNKVCSGYPQVPGEGAFDWAPISEAAGAQVPDHVNAQTALRMISQPQSKPFFINVGLLATHVAWFVPQHYFDLYPLDQVQLPAKYYSDDLDDIPTSGKALAQTFNFQNCITKQGLWASAVQGYLASITFVDDQIGALLDGLAASEHASNTVVMLWSDNGFHLGEKLHWHKLTLWEQATRVPLVIKLPGQIVGSEVNTPVSLIDLMPTVLDYTGIAAPYAMAGHSLRPLLENTNASWTYPVLMTANQYDYAIRTSAWRYIRYANGDRELYDETADAGEHFNVAETGAYVDVMAQLDALMPAKPALNS
jgi:arylsulfatase A-like enzyme